MNFQFKVPPCFLTQRLGSGMLPPSARKRCRSGLAARTTRCVQALAPMPMLFLYPKAMTLHDESFVKWCLENKELLQLLGRETDFTFEELQQARRKIWDRNGDMSGFLFADLAELCIRRNISNRAEVHMYDAICQAIGGRVLGNANQPDCVVDGVPVEAKRDYFSGNAMKQLRRYMDQMGSAFGIAAAPSLTAELSDDVFFLRVSYSREKSGYVVHNAQEALLWLESHR